MVDIKTPQCCTNPFIVIRLTRVFNAVLLFISALAMLLQNDNYISFAIYGGQYGAVVASFVFTVLLFLTAIALLVLHIMRTTLRLPRLLWVVALISLGVLTFIWFVVDSVYSKNHGIQMRGIGAAAVRSVAIGVARV